MMPTVRQIPLRPYPTKRDYILMGVAGVSLITAIILGLTNTIHGNTLIPFLVVTVLCLRYSRYACYLFNRGL